MSTSSVSSTGVPHKILAFDTAMSGCSVACADIDAGVFHSKSLPMKRGQAEMLVPMIDEVLKEAGLAYEELDAIATSVGPGAFTGLRIGLSTARAMGIALGVDVFGFSTLDLMAYRFAREKKPLGKNNAMLVVLETKRQDFYAQLFSNDVTSLIEPVSSDIKILMDIMSAYEGLEITVIGDAVDRFSGELKKMETEDMGFTQRLIHCNEFYLAEPLDMIRMLEEGHSVLPPEPLYLRGADVSKPKKNYRTISNHK